MLVGLDSDSRKWSKLALLENLCLLFDPTAISSPPPKSGILQYRPEYVQLAFYLSRSRIKHQVIHGGSP